MEWASPPSQLSTWVPWPPSRGTDLPLEAQQEGLFKVVASQSFRFELDLHPEYDLNSSSVRHASQIKCKDPTKVPSVAALLAMLFVVVNEGLLG